MPWQILPPLSAHGFVRQCMLEASSATNTDADHGAGSGPVRPAVSKDSTEQTVPLQQLHHHQSMLVEICGGGGAYLVWNVPLCVCVGVGVGVGVGECVCVCVHA